MFDLARTAIAVSVFLVAGCAAPLVTFENATPGAPLRVPMAERRPPGAGPFPAVVLMHGCHGVSAPTHEWARWFRDGGYVAVVVDSWQPRAIADGCVPAEPEVPNTARFDDAVGALRWLHTRPYVDRARVGIIGWSNGGVFAMAAVNGPSLERARARGVVMPVPGFRASVAMYPGGCYSLVKEQVVRPLLLLIGDADDWTSPRECAEMVEAMRARGADASIVLYAGAFHYFDVRGQARTYIAEVENRNKPGGCCGATVAYDAAAAEDARRRIGAFFGYHLK
ncbi:MAG TPA: dienelactone hydrolase family protein [Candidatus Limnocylindria bacterium]|nr:dienelactone hydrolase family protein [Candidatus Limnocylindria bacterium]